MTTWIRRIALVPAFVATVVGFTGASWTTLRAQPYDPNRPSPGYVPPAFRPGQRGSGPSEPVELRLRIFIPAPAVSLVNILGVNDLGNFACNATNRPPINADLCLFRGDDRGFSYSDGTQRFFSNVTLLPGGGVRETTYYCRTHEYEPNAGTHPNDKPWWWWSINPDARQIDAKKLDVKGGNTDVLVTNLLNYTTTVDYKIRGANPLVTGPPIDLKMLVFLSYAPGTRLTASVEGAHDGFPAYELYVNGRLMRGTGLPYDPAATFGASPYSLTNSVPLFPR